MGDKKIIHWMAVGCFCALLTVAFVRDFRNVQQGYSSDLRKRIVGARYQQAGLSPYFHKWQPGQPETFCIPHESGPLMRQNVVSLPPSYLWLLQPLAKLAFPTVEKIWLGLQYLFFIVLTALFWWLAKEKKRHPWVLLIASALLFSKGWIYNVDIGQSYMVFPVLWGIGYAMGIKTGHIGRWAGILLAICCWLRPVCGIMIFPFLFSPQKRAFLMAFLLTGIVLALQPLLFGQMNNWWDFFQSSKLWSQYYGSLSGDSYSDFGNGAWPPSIEGQSDFSIKPQLPEYTANLPIVCQALWGIRLPTYGSIALLLIFCSGLLYVAFRRKKARSMSGHHVWLMASMVYYAAELLMAVPKPSYYLVELFFAIYLVASNALPTAKAQWMLLAAGLILALLPSGIIPMHLLIGEYILVTAILWHLGSDLMYKTGFDNVKLRIGIDGRK